MRKRIIAGLLVAALCLSMWGCKEKVPGQTVATEPKCDHQMGDWLVKRQATCAKEGREERICMICYYSESRSLPMIDHSYKNGSNLCKKCYYVNMDPDAEVVELGILSERSYGLSSFANNCWDIKIWNGQVFRGAGDYDKNSGAAPIFAFDIATGKWQNYGTVPDMAIHGYSVIDGKLCAAGIDPSGGWDAGNFYRLEDGKWKTVRTIPNGIHNFDLVEFDGKIFAGVGTEDADDTVAVSTDGGESFTYLPLYKDGQPFDTSEYKWSRTYEFTEYNGQLYALISFQMNIGSSYKLFRYEDGKMVWLCDNVSVLLGGSSVSRKYWGGEFEFDGACYLTLGALYAIRNFADPASYEKISMPNKEKVADAFVRDGVIYVLGSRQDMKTKEYNIVIYQSTTGKADSFTPAATFTYSAPPLSFDTDGNHFYVGIGYNSAVVEKCGMVLRVKPNV